MGSEKEIRLKDYITPFRYELLIEPNMSGKEYEGSEIIYANSSKPTKAIRLNCKNITIKTATVRFNESEQTAKIRYLPEREEAELRIGKEVNGNIAIKIGFSGIHNENLFGFYRSNYTQKGENRSMLTTQFEPTGARLAFPCFDEPAMKAVFEIALLIDPELEAVSNMPVKSESAKGKKKLVTFIPTPKMSTYLVYLGVGKFNRISGMAGRTKLGLITVPGRAEWGRLAFQYAKKFVKFYESYFGIRYQLPKLDLIAIPDFAAGAMENWGAITFREVELIADPKATSTSTRQRIAEVVAHELAHQWFGDLVTLSWWDDTWLNESFATFMSYKAMGEVFPEWDAASKYLDQEVSRGFSSDNFVASHPVNMHVGDASHAASMFDDISYRKGGALLLMFNDYVGESVFRGGLKRYLKKHSYSNAAKEDLWKAIDDFAFSHGKRTRLADIASEWIGRAGHPTISAIQHKTGTVLEQRRLTVSKVLNEKPWPVPIRYSSGNGAPQLLMLNKKKAKLNGKANVKLNYGQSGFYKVQYSDKLLDYVGELLKEDKLSRRDAWGIENDLFFLLRSGRLPLNNYLNYIAKYMTKSGYPVSSNISSHLSWLYSITDGDILNEKVKKAGISYHLGLLKSLGWIKKPGEKTYDTIMRSSVIAWLGSAGEHGTLKRLVELFNSKRIDPDIRSSVYIAVASNGGKKEFEEIKKRYIESSSPEEKRILLAALGNFKDKSLIKASLDFSMSNKVRLQDSIFIPLQMPKTNVGRQMLLEWEMANWKRLMEIYDPSANMLSNLAIALSTITDKKAKDRISKFFSDSNNVRGDIERDIKIAMESIDANIMFLASNR
jgi:tricorn protease interacting factor F2/3